PSVSPVTYTSLAASPKLAQARPFVNPRVLYLTASSSAMGRITAQNIETTVKKKALRRFTGVHAPFLKDTQGVLAVADHRCEKIYDEKLSNHLHANKHKSDPRSPR